MKVSAFSIVLLVAASAFGQQNDPSKDSRHPDLDFKSILDDATKHLENGAGAQPNAASGHDSRTNDDDHKPRGKTLSLPNIAEVESPENLPADLKEAYHAAVKAHFEQETWSLGYRQRIFEWQFWAGIVVFMVSIGVVGVGLWMSCLQFYAFYRQSAAAVASAATSPAEPLRAGAAGAVAKTSVTTVHTESASVGPRERLDSMVNQIELSTSGVKVATPIVGIIILALSLGFFYMYLAFVFPIE